MAKNSEIENIERLMENKDVEFRDFKLTSIETRKDEEGNEKLIIEGTPCVYDTETILFKGKYWELHEIIARGAFDEADTADVIFNYNHCGRVFARTRNNSLTLEDKPDGLHMKAELWKDDEGHKELYRDIQRKNIDKMSFAFTIEESEIKIAERDDGADIETRTITKVKRLYDVSAVDIPAYDATEISARRTFDTEREKRKTESAEAESQARALKLRKKKLKLKLMYGGQ